MAKIHINSDGNGLNKNLKNSKNSMKHVKNEDNKNNGNESHLKSSTSFFFVFLAATLGVCCFSGWIFVFDDNNHIMLQDDMSSSMFI